MAYPSIFNDVIGPVMRGPSSSHCAAALRIGRLARDLMDGRLEQVAIDFDPNGSLATTHASQGSDMGLLGGLLGWEATDERLVDSAEAAAAAGMKIDFRIVDYGATHPNTYRLTLKNGADCHALTAISTGGGMIEVIEIDGSPVSIAGDYFETLIDAGRDGAEIFHFLQQALAPGQVLLHGEPGSQFIEVKAQAFLPETLTAGLVSRFRVRSIRRLAPVLPVLSRPDIQVPFIRCDEMLAYNAGKDLALWELAVHYESARGNLPPEQVVAKMREIIGILEASIQQGLRGTRYANRILGDQSGAFHRRMQEKTLLESGMLNQMILFVTALMEVKSSMGVIVASPTAGACGGLPGACIGAARSLGLSIEETTRAMLAAGMIGVLIAAHATFAAEVGGCQAECGSGSGMAAAALVTLANGTARQALDAASMALQNVLGMICDPVANRVEVPCLGKNVLAASNALACANMALAGFDAVIPLDEVIETMDRVGKSIPPELRCTALGGLSITRTSKAIENRLRQAGDRA